MAAILKQKSGRWRAQVRRKDGYVSETFCLRKDAEAWGHRIERDLGLEISPAARTRDARSGSLAATCSGVSALI